MVKQWEERALVGLFRADSRNMLRLPAYRSLEEIADRTRLAFFAQTFQISRATKPEESRESPRVQDLLRRTLHTSRTVREWGINE